jgi:MFS family permease
MVTTGQADTRAQVPESLWRHRNFLLLWTGQTVSETGSAVTTVAIPLIAIAVLKASTFEVGLLAAATYVAFSLIALPAGVVVDRLAKRKIMMWCDGARLLVVGTIPVLAALHVLALWQLYMVALVAGAFTVFFDVSYQSYIPSIVDSPQLIDGFGKLSASASFAQVSGPGIAAGLVAVVGAAEVLLVDAFSYAASFVCLLSITGRESKPEVGERTIGQLKADIVSGIPFLWKHPVLRKTTAYAAIGNLFIAMQISLNILFLIRVLNVRPSVAALLAALGSLGGIIGGMSSQLITRRIGSARIMWVSALILDAPSLVLPLAEPGFLVTLFVIGYAASSFAFSIFGAAQLSYRQSVCPPEQRGKMNAASRWVTWGILPFGGLLGGALGSTIGIRNSEWIAFTGAWLAGFFLFCSPLRRVRDTGDLATDLPRPRAYDAAESYCGRAVARRWGPMPRSSGTRSKARAASRMAARSTGASHRAARSASRKAGPSTLTRSATVRPASRSSARS